MLAPMSDLGLPELERNWRVSGADEDLAHLLRARVRAGLPAQERVELAAFLGQPAARAAVTVRADDPPWNPWAKALDRPAARAFVIHARCVLLDGEPPPGGCHPAFLELVQTSLDAVRPPLERAIPRERLEASFLRALAAPPHAMEEEIGALRRGCDVYRTNRSVPPRWGPPARERPGAGGRAAPAGESGGVRRPARGRDLAL